ncbi:MAG: hypothetical protein L0K86_05235 [Actinomycetia bacterium]|nr:hypothetical protein [Actinomycetes bacterium]
MDVQLRVVVARVVLQELRGRQAAPVDPPAGAAAVVPGPGVAGLLGQEVQRRAVPYQQALLEHAGLALPLRGGFDVAGRRGVHGGPLAAACPATYCWLSCSRIAASCCSTRAKPESTLASSASSLASSAAPHKFLLVCW